MENNRPPEADSAKQGDFGCEMDKELEGSLVASNFLLTTLLQIETFRNPDLPALLQKSFDGFLGELPETGDPTLRISARSQMQLLVRDAHVGAAGMHKALGTIPTSAPEVRKSWWKRLF